MGKAITPMMVDIESRNVVIIGGGRVAYKRAKTLLESNANITIISPDVIDELRAMTDGNQLNWKKKKFEPSDLQGAFLVVIATNDEKENERITAFTSEVPLINRADGGTGGNIHFPGRISRGRLTIAMSTGGASPMLTSQLKKDLEKQFDPSYEHYVDFLYECRQRIKQMNVSKEAKHYLLKKILQESYRDPERQQEVFREIAGEEKNNDGIER